MAKIELPLKIQIQQQNMKTALFLLEIYKGSTEMIKKGYNVEHYEKKRNKTIEEYGEVMAEIANSLNELIN